MRVSIGQDSHRFDLRSGERENSCILGGVVFPNTPALLANSDGDVVLHAVTNAISGITCRNILGPVADAMCRSGITDSRAYLEVALQDLWDQGWQVEHLSISLECLRPKIFPLVEEMRKSIASLLHVTTGQVGITATTGEGLTECGNGEGISVFCVLTVKEKGNEN